VIAPDPAQAGMKISRESMVNKLKALTSPQIIDWAVHTKDINAVAERIRNAGVAFDGPTPGSRKRPDGKVLHWQTLNLDNDQDGLLPFFIQWSADSVHPSADAPSGCRIESFAVANPTGTELAAMFRKLGIEVDVEKTEKPRIFALIIGPRGQLNLR
jgi:hypothetical protein